MPPLTACGEQECDGLQCACACRCPPLQAARSLSRCGRAGQPRRRRHPKCWRAGAARVLDHSSVHVHAPLPEPGAARREGPRACSAICHAAAPARIRSLRAAAGLRLVVWGWKQHAARARYRASPPPLAPCMHACTPTYRPSLHACMHAGACLCERACC
jgi:hypothetical protein